MEQSYSWTFRYDRWHNKLQWRHTRRQLVPLLPAWEVLAGGTEITISGSNLSDVQQVKFGGRCHQVSVQMIIR